MNRARAAVAAATLVVALALCGCSAAGSGLDAQTSADWQARVVAVADLAVSADSASGLAELAALEAQVLEARRSGDISAERAAIIQQSVALVRADLQAAGTPPTVPEPLGTDVVIDDPAGDGTEDEGDDGNKGNKGDKGNSGKKDKGKDAGNGSDD